jgi:hypothetical protein
MVAPSQNPYYAGGTATLTADELGLLLDVVKAAKTYFEAQKNETYDSTLQVALDKVYSK